MPIREAHAADADAVAALHAASWRATYGPLLGADFARRDIEAERRAYWREALAGPFEGFVLIDEDDAGLTGFIAVLDHGEEGYDAAIDNLHVEQTRSGRGLGRRLIAAAARRLQRDGRTSVALRVLDDNARAVAFYERLGGTADASGVDLHFGSDAHDTRFGWRDLDALIAACEEQSP